MKTHKRLSAVFLPLGWIYWIKANGFSNGVSHFQSWPSLQSFFLLLRINLYNLLDNQMPVLTMILMVSVWLFCRRRALSGEQSFLKSVSVLMVVFVMLAHIGYGTEQLLDLPAEGFPRIYMHATPPLLFFSPAGSALAE